MNSKILYGGDFEEPKCKSFGELIINRLQQRGDEIVLVRFYYINLAIK